MKNPNRMVKISKILIIFIGKKKFKGFTHSLRFKEFAKILIPKLLKKIWVKYTLSP
jgi:hypothetical protein